MRTRKLKLRAECAPDAAKLIQILADNQYATKFEIKASVHIPDVEVTIQTAAEIETIKNLIGLIDDGHVMAQTIEEAEKYTGERKP